MENQQRALELVLKNVLMLIRTTNNTTETMEQHEQILEQFVQMFLRYSEVSVQHSQALKNLSMLFDKSMSIMMEKMNKLQSEMETLKTLAIQQTPLKTSEPTILHLYLSDKQAFNPYRQNAKTAFAEPVFKSVYSELQTEYYTVILKSNTYIELFRIVLNDGSLTSRGFVRILEDIPMLLPYGSEVKYVNFDVTFKIGNLNASKVAFYILPKDTHISLDDSTTIYTQQEHIFCFMTGNRNSLLGNIDTRTFLDTRCEEYYFFQKNCETLNKFRGLKLSCPNLILCSLPH